MKVGLDTNILVRYLVQDDLAQAKKAKQFIEEMFSYGKTCFISSIVLCELVWVLEAVYDTPKSEIITTLRLLLRAREFEFDNHTAVQEAIESFELGKADFSDYLIGRLNARYCETTVTFDRALKSSDHFKILV